MKKIIKIILLKKEEKLIKKSEKIQKNLIEFYLFFIFLKNCWKEISFPYSNFDFIFLLFIEFYIIIFLGFKNEKISNKIILNFNNIFL